MYRSYHDPTMIRAIARQDEALEDLIRSTRQVIRKHSAYLEHTSNHDDYSFHRRRSHANHKPRLQPLAPPPPPLQSHCSRHCCESMTKPLPPKTHHHHPHVQPPPPQQPSYQPQPVPTKSRTKTWLNKIIPSKAQCETDDELVLHDLKKKMCRPKPKPPQLPSIKTTGRPMIIPSVAASPEKVVVVDVPADTTVILRSMDVDDSHSSKQMAAIHHITDMNIIHQLFGHVVQMTESKSTGDIKADTDTAGIKKMSKSHTMQLGSIQTTSLFPLNSGPNTSSSTSSATTIVNARERSQALPQKKPKEMTQYLSIPAQLSLRTHEFHYLDSDASTVDHRGEHSPSSTSSTASSLYYHGSKSIKQEPVPQHVRGRWMQ